MNEVLFNGKNISEVAELTGLPVIMGSEVRNCSSEHPEGFDYPTAQVQTDKGLLEVSMHQTIARDVDQLSVKN